MKILVIGASGFIGNACFKYFSELVDASGKKNETFGFDCAGKMSKNLIIDSDFTALPALISENFDVVLNCAGSSNIQESFTDTGKDFWLNVVFIQNILELIKTLSPATKIINISSAAVYGNPELLPVNEGSPTHPLSPYGLHKLLSEKVMEEYAALFSLNTLSVRIFSAYGPGLKRQFFYDLYSKFNLHPDLVQLNGSGKESRDFIFISDITEALNVLIQKGQFRGTIYNLASEQESFIGASAQLFAEICGYQGEIKFNGQQYAGYPLNWKADTTKLKSTGFSPKISLAAGLELYFNWLKNN